MDSGKRQTVVETSQPLSKPAHSLSFDAVLSQLASDPEEGLSASEAKGRIEIYGQNVLSGDEGVSIVKIVIKQIANAMMLVLIIAMAVSFGIESFIEGGVIAAVIGLNIVVGVYQDYGAEKTMDSLRSLSSPTGTVTRDGKTSTIPANEIVPGDMIELKVGETVPADLRLVEAFNFEADEALLTGESLPVHKDADAIFDEETGPGDRLNIAYSSSTVTRGRARGVVVGTGMVTEIGAIAVALRGGDSKVRPVKRGPQGETKKRWYLQAWALTTTDAVGRFLGVNVGTPLQRKLSKLALVLFAIAVIFAIVVMGANKMRGDKEVIIYAVATGLAMIPACLVVVLTITMAGGTKQMAQRNVIVRKLDSLEALGAVTNICSDKTGTLTQGRMVAKRAWIPSLGTYSIGPSSNPLDPHEGDVSLVPDVPVNIGDQSDENPSKPEDLVQDNPILKDFLNIASMANLAHVHKTAHGEWQARGEPTDIAIQVLASRFQWNRERWTKGEKPVWRQKAEYPFDSTVKKMSVIFAKDEGRDKGKEMIFTKGAVERVLQSCTSVKWIGDSGIIPLDAKVQSGILQNMEALAKLGLRVLALASREHRPGPVSEEKLPREDVEKDLTLCGLIGIYDPPRPETAGAIEQCRRAGITAHMVTGDHPGTARAIAAQVGIIPSSTEGLAADVAEAMVMTASQFDRLTDEEIDKLPQLPAVIARCAPNTKVRMIEALHRRGRYAAMTGDGVNDSPSLKRADVGIAMGQAGSDVAKDASELVLMDDNFASIINGIEEGRRIFDNIQKFVLHLLAENVALALTLLIGLAFKDETGQSVFPIAPVEILWIIMITSGLPDMGLGREAAAADVMDRPPQSKQGIFTWEVIIDMFVYGVWMAALCLAAFSLVLFGWGDGNLSRGCNTYYRHVAGGREYSCDTVFRARATTFTCMTWFALFLAWELIDMRRSFFQMQPGSKRYLTQWMLDVWKNKFLFCGIMVGFVTIFPILYIPRLNDVVFKHTGISWEWGIVFVEALLFFQGVEAWKWCKRAYSRRRGAGKEEPGETNEGSSPYTSMSYGDVKVEQSMV